MNRYKRLSQFTKTLSVAVGIVVARVANDASEGSVPLPVGLFVQARIAGRTAADVMVVPGQALQNESSVLVVDAENRLRRRTVEVLRIERNEALISGGLAEGERVCISPIQAPVDGMEVNPVELVPVPREAEGA